MNEERTGKCLRQGEHIRGHLWHSPFVFVTEPIQSRCAVLRYSKLTDQQVLKRLLEVCESEKVSYTDDGLEAIVFTAQGDMRQVTLIWFNDLIYCV
jgi:replication-associated recombination protein RarA